MDADEQGRSGRWLRWLLLLALVGGALIGVERLLGAGGSLEEGAGTAPVEVDGRPGGPAGLWRNLGAGAGAPTVGSGPAETTDPPTPTVPLRVRVIGPEGPEPAAGATVFLDDVPLGITGADGRLETAFPLDGESHDAWAETAEAKAVAFTLREERLPADELTLVLGGTGTIRGLVRMPGGEAAAAEITIHPEIYARFATGPDGRFVVEALPEGPYRLTARAQGAQGSRRMTVVAGTTQEVFFGLRPTEPLAGRVVDELGQPLSGMKVTGMDLAEGDRVDWTDEEGRFELVAIAEREILLLVDGEGRSARYRGRARTDLELVAPPGGALTLRVRSPDGEPVRDGVFELLQLDVDNGFPGQSPLEPTPEPGVYRSRALAAGTWRVATRGIRTGPRANLAQVVLGPGEERELAIVLPGGSEERRGVVLDAASQEPVSGARVFLGRYSIGRSSGRVGDHTRTTVTDGEGRFVFERVEAEDRHLLATSEGYRGEEALAAEGGERRLLLHPERRLRGRVIDERGLPLMRFKLDRDSITVSDGSFDELLEDGKEQVSITAPGHVGLVRPLPSGTGDVDLGDLVLRATGPTRIRVLDPSGQPATGAWVTCIPRDRPSGEGKETTISPAAGAEGWSQVLLWPGPYDFQAWHHRVGEGRSEWHRQEISGNDTVELRLRSLAHIHGNAGGPGREISAWPEGSRTRSKPDGSYRLGPIDASEVTLILTSDELVEERGERRSLPLSLEPGEERRYDFEDPVFGGVRIGCQVEGDGTALLFSPTRSPERGPLLRRRIRTSLGRGCPVLFRGLPAGPYELRIELDEGEGVRTLGPRTVEIEAGAITELELGG